TVQSVGTDDEVEALLVRGRDCALADGRGPLGGGGGALGVRGYRAPSERVEQDAVQISTVDDAQSTDGVLGHLRDPATVGPALTCGEALDSAVGHGFDVVEQPQRLQSREPVGEEGQ